MIKLSRFIAKNLSFFIILGCALLVRLYVFDYPIVAEETNRDFLIARHIAKYKEFVSLGPKNGTLLSFGNSPTYFYFLALQFALFDNVMLISFINLLMQLAIIVILYFLTKKTLGKETAVIASLFFSFSGLSITAAVWPWQPYAMYFFWVLSFFFLFLAYKGGKKLHLYLAGFLFALSTSLHMSAFASFPFFILASFLILRSQKTSFGKYFLFFLFLGTVIVALFLPPIIHSYKLGTNPFSPLGGVLTQKPADSIAFLFDRVNLLTKTLPTMSAVAFFGSLFYLKKEKKREKKKVYLLLLFGVISFLAIFSLIDGRFFDQHLYPIFPFLVILASENLRSLTRNFGLFAKYILIISLVILGFRGATDKARGFSFIRLQSARTIATNLALEVERIKATEAKGDFQFFQFQVYAPPEVEWFNGNRDIVDSIYWLLLEKKMDTKFVEVSDNILEAGYKNRGSRDYIFLNCINYFKAEELCLNRFLTNFPSYNIEKKVGNTVYGNSFFLAKDIALSGSIEE